MSTLLIILYAVCCGLLVVSFACSCNTAYAFLSPYIALFPTALALFSYFVAASDGGIIAAAIGLLIVVHGLLLLFVTG